MDKYNLTIAYLDSIEYLSDLTKDELRKKLMEWVTDPAHTSFAVSIVR